MLDVSKLGRQYGDFKAVDDVSFTIGKGEIVGLLGHNGAGKTTIMKMLSGYLEPNAGAVRIDGIDLAQKPKQIQRELGYLPESLPIYPEMTVADYLDYAADLKGLQAAEKTNEIKRAVAATEISGKLLAPIATLSRGYKQRVGVAQAILGKPKLLILDEPTNGLDPTQTEHMRQLIRDMAKEATVILSTHIMQEVEAVCDRVLILSSGKLVVDAKLDELRNSNRLLLATSIEESRLREKLAAVPDIDRIDAIPVDEEGVFEYRIFLSEGETRPVSAAIAKAILDNQGELYQLQHEKRDLETLFRELSDGASRAPSATTEEDLSDAA